MTWTRRSFIRASTLGLLAVGSGSRALARVVRGAAQPGGEFIELRGGVGIFRSRGGTIGWLVNHAGGLVVDSQYPDTAALCLAGLEQRGGEWIDALVNTHHHGDHTAGNGVFRDAAGQIVAHQRVPELQRAAAERAGTMDAQTYADVTFLDRWAIEVGEEVVRAEHYGPAHTGGDCVVVFQNAGVAHMGDLVFNRAYPFIDRPGGASVAGWIRLLDTVADDLPADTAYIFGHGSPAFGVTGGRDDVLRQRDFLAVLLDTARGAVARGESREEATAMETLPGFEDYTPLVSRLTLGNALGEAYDEVVEST